MTPDIPSLTKQLETAPDAIRKASACALHAHDASNRAALELREYETALLEEVSNETDDAGKPRFGNESKRKAEVTRRQALDGAYERLKTQAEEASYTLRMMQIDLEYEQNRFRSLLMLARLQAPQ